MVVGDQVLHILSHQVGPVGGGRGPVLPDEVLLHLGRSVAVVVLETSHLLQDGRTAHAQYQRGRGRREQGTLYKE